MSSSSAVTAAGASSSAGIATDSTSSTTGVTHRSSDALLTSSTMSIETPMDLIKVSLNEKIFVKCKTGRELTGILHAYDTHLNLILSDVTETITTLDIDPSSGEERSNIRKRDFEMLFLRGDSVILIAPPTRTSA